MNPEAVRLVGMELRLENSSRWGGVEFHGDTMRPFLQDGDELTIEPATWQDVWVGDIITYREAHKFPTRRVIQIHPQNRRLIIKGDGMPMCRFFRVPADDVLGRVVARKRGSEVITNKHLAWRIAAKRAVLRAELDLRFRRVRRALLGRRSASTDPQS